jgi:hypothetical protein
MINYTEHIHLMEDVVRRTPSLSASVQECWCSAAGAEAEGASRPA